MAELVLRLPDAFLQPTATPQARVQQTIQQESRRISRGTQDWPDGSQDPVDVQLRLDCEWNLELFAQQFFRDAVRDPLNVMHRDFIQEHAQRQGARGRREATAAPRGAAKTTWKGKIELIHDGLYGHENYIGICSANADLARDKTKEVRDVFTDNTELIRIYGPQQTRDWRQGDFIIQGRRPDQPCRYRAFSPHSKVRGFVWKNRRPSKILLDDAEDPEVMLTELRRERFEQWFSNDVAKLGDRHTNFEVIGTILHPDSLLSKLLKNPGWRARHYRAVLHFADNPEAWRLWQEWRRMVLDLMNEHRLQDAWQFYLAHEDVMLQGVEVLWPEHESYYDLMLSRVVDGESAFWQEKQNEPQHDTSYLFDTSTIATVQVQPNGLLRDDGHFVPWLDIVSTLAFYDPTPGDTTTSTRDWAACPVICHDRHGYCYVVDTYLEQTDDQDAQITAIVDLCWRWQVEKLGIETNAFAANLVRDFREAFAKRAAQEGRQWSPLLCPVKHTRNKILRIRTIQPPLANQWILLSDRLPAHAWEELQEFTVLTDDNRDDFLDALAAAWNMVSDGDI